MSRIFSAPAPLQSIFWSKHPAILKEALLITAGVVLLAIASQLSVPLKPVPLTFQSATVVLIGMAYGARRGSYVILGYLLSGSIGLPVFANFSSGLAEFTGPTGGYLIGFLPAAYLCGLLAQRGFATHFLYTFLSACVGACIIFSLGLVVLAQYVGLQEAVTLGLLPFLVSEPIKLIVVSMLVPRVWKKT